MPSIQQLVQKKLNKRRKPSRLVMAKTKTRTIVLRPSMRVHHRTSRRASVSRGIGIFKGGLGGVKRTLEPYATALGMGTIFVAGASKVKPDLSMQQAQIVGLAGEYIGGGFKGALGAEALKAIMGLPSVFTSLNILGGGGQQQMQNLGGGSALL